MKNSGSDHIIFIVSNCQIQGGKFRKSNEVILEFHFIKQKVTQSALKVLGLGGSI